MGDVIASKKWGGRYRVKEVLEGKDGDFHRYATTPEEPNFSNLGRGRIIRREDFSVLIPPEQLTREALCA